MVISGARRDDLEVAAKGLDVDAIVCDATDPASLAEARAQFPTTSTPSSRPRPRWAGGDPAPTRPPTPPPRGARPLDATVVPAVLTLQNIGDHQRSGGPS